MKPLNYLFYKIYIFFYYLSDGSNPITHIAAMGILLLLNILTIYLSFSNKPISQNIAIGSILIVGLFILPYAFPNRTKKIVSKYEKESEKSRIIGNLFVISYMIITIVTFIIAIKISTPV